jgi:hypothetical protein
MEHLGCPQGLKIGHETLSSASRYLYQLWITWVSLKILRSAMEHLKVPKRENFWLAFLALSKATWVCDLGSGEKIRIFYQMTPDFEGLWFFAAYSVCGK